MNTYLDIPVLELEPDAGGDARGAFERAITEFDPATGPRDLYDRAFVQFPSETEVNFICEGRDQINAWFDFMYTVLGRLGVFWMPSWKKDFQPTEDVGDGEAQITVEATGYTEFAMNGSLTRDYLAIITPGPNFTYTHISSADNLGDTDVLGLDDSIGPLGKDDFLPCFLRLCRLDSDDIEMLWTSPERLEVTVNVRELPFEFPEPGATGIPFTSSITCPAAILATLCPIFGFSFNAGDKGLLLIQQYATSGAAVSSVTDNQGNSWTLQDHQINDGGYSWWVYVCESPTATATTVTITVSGAGVGLETSMATLMSVPSLQSSPYDGAQNNSGTGTTQPDSGAGLAATSNRTFCVALLNFKSAVQPVFFPGTGYQENGSSNSGQDNALGEYGTFLGALPRHATVITDGTSATRWGLLLANFKAEE